MALVQFGTRSPHVVEYEETDARNFISPIWSVLGGGGALWALNRGAVVRVEDMTPEMNEAGFIACEYNPIRRSALVDTATDMDLGPTLALVDPGATVTRSSLVGDGNFLNAGMIVGSVSRLGEHVSVNRASSIGHHCNIDEQFSIVPGLYMPSNVRAGFGAVVAVAPARCSDYNRAAGFSGETDAE